MAYLFENFPEDILYMHTWSGNFPMVALATKVGFTESERVKNHHVVNGAKYDALTFSITKKDFYARHSTLFQNIYSPKKRAQ